MISGYTETLGAMVMMATSLLADNPIYDIDVDNLNVRETFCLAQNIWFEARNTSLEDQILVAQTTINRVHDRRYESTICEVVWEHRQFSWTHDGKSDAIQFTNPIDVRIWNQILETAILVQEGYIEDRSNGATHYHAHYVSPGWARKKIWLTSTDGHRFYKSKNYDKFMEADYDLEDAKFVKRIRMQMMRTMFNTLVSFDEVPDMTLPSVADPTVPISMEYTNAY